jgi:hypothetical protein
MAVALPCPSCLLLLFVHPPAVVHDFGVVRCWFVIARLGFEHELGLGVHDAVQLWLDLIIVGYCLDQQKQQH